MAPNTPGPTDSTWKPSGPLDSVPARSKGRANSTAPLRNRAMAALAIQGVLLLVLLAAAFFVRDTPFTSALYLWAGVIPIGFAIVYYMTYKRGSRVREEKKWTIEFERGEAKRAYRAMGVVLVVWMAGLVGVWFLFR